MRALLLAFLLALSTGVSAYDATVRAVWTFDNNADITEDTSGNGYDLTEFGTVTQDADAGQGDYSASGFSSTNYFKWPAGLTTEMAGDTTWAIEFYIKDSNITSVQTHAVAWDDQSVLYFNNPATGAPRLYINPTNHSAASSTVADSTWTNVAFVSDGSNITYYIGGTSAGTSSCGTCDIPAGAASIGIRKILNDGAVDMLDAVIVHNNAETSFPTTIEAASTLPIRIGPSLELDRGITLLDRIMGVFATPLNASIVYPKGGYERVQQKSASSARRRLVVAEKTRTVLRMERGEITPTPTPGRPTPTPTPTPTPSKRER